MPKILAVCYQWQQDVIAMRRIRLWGSVEKVTPAASVLTSGTSCTVFSVDGNHAVGRTRQGRVALCVQSLACGRLSQGQASALCRRTRIRCDDRRSDGGLTRDDRESVTAEPTLLGAIVMLFFCAHQMAPSEVSKTFGVLSSVGAILWSLQAIFICAEPCFVLIGAASSSRLGFH
jgi:hypothetical protein